MTGQRPAEERIAQWLEEEAAGFLPDRVLDATFDQTRSTSQARPSLWRPFSMSRPIPALIAVGAAAIVLIAGAIYLRPTATSDVGGTPAATPSRSPDGSAQLTFHAGPLEPGDYSTTAFEPALTFTLGSGWQGFGTDDASSINIDRPAEAGTLAMARVTDVIDPATRLGAAAPDDLVRWLVEHPSFEWNADPTPATIAGLTGSMLEGRVVTSAEMFPLPGGTMRVESGWHIRYYVLPLDGPDLTIIIFGVSAADFAETLAASEPVLDSLVITQ